MIIVGGENVYAQEVENVITRHEKVLEAAGLQVQRGGPPHDGAEAWLCLLTDRVDRPLFVEVPIGVFAGSEKMTSVD